MYLFQLKKWKKSHVRNCKSAEQAYKNLLTDLFPEENRGKDAALRTFELILCNDTKGLSDWIATDTAKRVNATATKMLLHPLHVCAMTGNLECATILIQSGCNINPQDASGATPIHHAAVRNHQAMIAFFLMNKAASIPDRFGGTYANVLQQIREPNPEAQVFHYKNEKEEIVQGNGDDFRRITGAAFLDKECRVTPKEWLKLWQGKTSPPQMVTLSLEAQYEVFCKKAPKVYLERHSEAGWNVCAGEEIKVGTVIGEYLGDFQEDATLNPKGVTSFEKLEEVRKSHEYCFDHIDATHFRGIVPMCNDSFPNTEIFGISHKKGIRERLLLVANQPIKMGEPIVYLYGLGHNVRLGQRIELRKKALIDFFTTECKKGFLNVFNRMLENRNDHLLKQLLPEGKQALTEQAFLYALTTPSAILPLLCESTIKVDEIKTLFGSYLSTVKAFANGNLELPTWTRLENFYRTVFQYFDKLNDLPKSKKTKTLTQLAAKAKTSSTDQLITIMGGDPQAYKEEAFQALAHKYLTGLQEEKFISEILKS